jgi:hypothetical protein
MYTRHLDAGRKRQKTDRRHRGAGDEGRDSDCHWSARILTERWIAFTAGCLPLV